jgi:hypothetical protein
MPVPTLEEFKQVCREAFAFLTTEYSFAEVAPRARPYNNPFEVQFSNGELTVIVEGGGYGHTAGVSIEDRSGRRASFGHIVERDIPRDERYTFGEGGQLALIRREAQLLQRFGKRLLAGDMAEFEWMVEERAKVQRRFAEEQKLWPLKHAWGEANAAFSRGDYKRVVELLSPFSTLLSDLQRKKLEYAKKHC